MCDHTHTAATLAAASGASAAAQLYRRASTQRQAAGRDRLDSIQRAKKPGGHSALTAAAVAGADSAWQQANTSRYAGCHRAQEPAAAAPPNCSGQVRGAGSKGRARRPRSGSQFRR